MTTAQKTFVAGDTLTAADMNTYARGGQEMGYASITATSSNFTTVADITSLTATWTAISTRVYELEFVGCVASSVAGDEVNMTITDSSNTVVGGTLSDLSATAGRRTPCNVKVRLTGLSGSVTYKVRGTRNAGTGNCSVFASATQPATFQVLDVGAN